ncbi:TetR family transcriptional regulator [Spirillospora sp. NPDC047279]|uniref:TetR/AcrR family transcriptional regulator n=1 Tax=Spirillospora sp. NPDC047279 TaxID=3155478 RepID=UPI0033E40276
MSTPEPARDRTAAPDRTGARDRILNATLRLIGEQGLGAVTNRAVAKAAGVSLGSLTYHFPSQTDLLRESLQAFVDAEIARITAYVTRLRDADIDPDQAADLVEKAIIEFAYGPEQIANLELHLHAARDTDVRATAVRSVEAYDRLATAVLTALDIPDAERHAPAVVTMLYGLAVRRLATGDTSAAGTADAFRLLLRGALGSRS